MTACPTIPLPSPAAGARRERGWQHTALRTKLVLLTLLSAVGGSVVGTLAACGGGVVALSLGLTIVVALVAALALASIAKPLERLTHQAGRLHRSRRQDAGLPVRRRDEVGQMARLVHELYLRGVRHEQEAGRLRRTADHRILAATRQATAKLRQLAMRDPLTGVANRRFLDEHFSPLFETCRSAGQDLACLIIDLDHFKQVNDRLGHAAGDQILVLLAGLIRACTRRQDYVVRLGGDEFAVLLADCPPIRLRAFALHVRALFVRHTRLALPQEVLPDLSVGVATLTADRANSPSELLRVADQRLYQAKRAGGGHVVDA